LQREVQQLDEMRGRLLAVSCPQRRYSRQLAVPRRTRPTLHGITEEAVGQVRWRVQRDLLERLREKLAGEGMTKGALGRRERAERLGGGFVPARSADGEQ